MVSGGTILTGLTIGFAAFALFWLINETFNPSEPRVRGLGFLLAFAVIFLAAARWFAP